jgi:hypothetical protein
VAGLSYLLGDLLNRRVDTETSLLFLASRQATGVLFAALASSALVSTLTVRHLRSGAPEHESDSPFGAQRLMWARYGMYSLPILAGWVAYLLLTTVQRALSLSDPHHAAIVWFVTTFAVAASAAFGLMVAHVVKNYAAPVITAILVYGLVVAVGGNGDDAWWGWLVPYMDDAFRGGIKPAWAAGYTAWYLGLVALFINTAVVTTTLRRTGFQLSLRAALTTVGLLLTGAALLYLNGASAVAGG